MVLMQKRPEEFWPANTAIRFVAWSKTAVWEPRTGGGPPVGLSCVQAGPLCAIADATRITTARTSCVPTNRRPLTVCLVNRRARVTARLLFIAASPLRGASLFLRSIFYCTSPLESLRELEECDECFGPAPHQVFRGDRQTDAVITYN